MDNLHSENSIKTLQVQKHGIICSVPDGVLLGYFGWPTVAKLQDGTIAAACSGFRAEHICACGKSVLFLSKDNGETWNSGQIINDSMADDRDTGLLPMDNGELLMTWFASDVRVYIADKDKDNEYWSKTFPVLEAFDEEMIAKSIGSFIRFRKRDGRWTKPQQVLVSAPHGPIQLKNGDIFYLGCQYGKERPDGTFDYKMGDIKNGITAIRSSDHGRTWKTLGNLNPFPGKMFEPHAIELKDGSILGLIRVENAFSLYQTISKDGGLTWSEPVLITKGSPPHLMRHSSGTLVCTYARRDQGFFGEYAMFSHDEGKTWDTDYLIHGGADTNDLGYPSTIELDDGRMFSVYYQHINGHKHAALMYSTWNMPL